VLNGKDGEIIQTKGERGMRKLGILTVVLTLLSSSAWAFRGTCGLMEPGFGLNPHMASALELTEEQKALIQKKHEAFMEEINPLRNRLFSRKMELRDLWGQGNPDQGKISAKQREILAIQSQLQEKTIQYQMECRGLLSPEQQEKLGTAVAHRGRQPAPDRSMDGW
jgi:Spy/CpxP family protein refolding chaperone